MGHGTTFSFVLNFTIGDEIPFSQDKKYDPSKLANKKILLVEKSLHLIIL